MTNIKAYNGTEPYIFISYSHKDTDVMPLLKEIYSNDYRFWYDEGIISGRAWADEISKRIKGCCQFVVFISKNSIESENVKDEVHLAVKNNLDIQVIYIEDVKLSGGLELQLDRKQAISKNKFSTNGAFLNKLISCLSKSAIIKSDNCNNEAENKFKTQYTTIDNIPTRSTSQQTHIALKNNLNTKALVKHFTFKNSIFGSQIMDAATNEAAILKTLQAKNCPFTPKIFDLFVDKENVILVEEYINGKTLEQVIKTLDRTNKKSLQKKCVDICIKICDILRYLHNLEEPLVHRDIKPQNLILTDEDNVFLIDFDLCLRYKSIKPYEFISLGTKGYAAPEQYTSKAVPDNRADIYSLGILLTILLTKTSLDNFYPAQKNAPLRYFSKKFSPALEKIITKMTLPDADDRYSSVDDVIKDLQNYNHSNIFHKLILLIKSNIAIKKYINSLNKQKNTIPFTPPMSRPVPPPTVNASATVKTQDSMCKSLPIKSTQPFFVVPDTNKNGPITKSLPNYSSSTTAKPIVATYSTSSLPSNFDETTVLG